MKGTILVIAASALLGSAAAGSRHERGHGHQVFHDPRRAQTNGTYENATCGCTTYVTTYYGKATLIQPAPTTITVSPTPESSSSASSSAFSSSNSTSSTSINPVTTSTTSTATTASETPTSPSSPSTASTTSMSATPSSSAPSSSAPSSSAPSSSVPSSSAPSSSAAAHKVYEVSSSPSTTRTSATPSSSAAAPKFYEVASTSAAPAAPESSSQSPLQSSSQSISSSSSTSAGSSHSSSAPISSSGSQWCMTYSPYNADTTCKNAAAVSADIAAIASKGFTSVRLYSTDCNGLTNVGSAAAAAGLKLVLGVFISNTGISVAAEQIIAIIQWANGDYSAVELIVIGNEAIFNNFCTADALAALLSQAKATLSAAGYSGPVTTTEPMNILEEYAGTLCPVIDIAAANIHPFFNSGTSAGTAGAFVATTLGELAALCPGGKEAYNLETGWPHSGNANGVAVPGPGEQEVAILSIRKSAGGRSAFFSFVDDLWKAPGPDGVEQSWGCSQLFGD